MDASTLLFLFGAIVLVVVVGASLTWYVRYTSYRNDWRCERCAHVFAIGSLQALSLPSHLPRQPKVTCPNCGHRGIVAAVPRSRR